MIISLHESASNDFKEKSAEKKKSELYEKQKAMLDLFLEKHAIDQRQHDFSLSCLKEKMGIKDE